MPAVDRLVPRGGARRGSRLGPKLVRHRSPSSLPCASIQASPSGSVTISLCSWLIVEIVGSAVLEFGRGLFDWQWPGTALYGITAYTMPSVVSE